MPVAVLHLLYVLLLRRGAAAFLYQQTKAWVRLTKLFMTLADWMRAAACLCPGMRGSESPGVSEADVSISRPLAHLHLSGKQRLKLGLTCCCLLNDTRALTAVCLVPTSGVLVQGAAGFQAQTLPCVSSLKCCNILMGVTSRALQQL